MKQYISFFLIFVLNALASSVRGQSLSREVLSTNGGHQTAGGVSLSWTIGETVIPTFKAGNNILTQGFEQSESAIQTEFHSPNPVCAGNAVVVSYKASGIIGTGNIFTAELSDLDGNFYSSTVIGSKQSNSSGMIDAVIPENTVAGTHYRIRVIADKPAVTGNDNGTAIIIQPLITWYLDADGDHYYTGNGTVQCTSPGTGFTSTDFAGGNDCDDANSAVNPGMPDVCNGIDDNCDYLVDENKITASIALTGKRENCEGAAIVLTANSGTGIRYQWKGDGTEIPGATGIKYSVEKGGSYTVDEINDFGCHATAPLVSINLNPSPAAIITPQGSLDICVAGNVVLKANGGSGFFYQWIKGSESIAGATNKSYTASIAAKYKVKITNPDNCSSTSAPVVVVKSCRMEESKYEFEHSKLLVYPNPTSGAFVVELFDVTRISTQVEIQVFNLLGQSVYEHRSQMNSGMLQQEVNFNETFSAGTYLVRVIQNDKVYVEQVIFQ